MNISKLSNEELFSVLLCGEKPVDGFTMDDYVNEWNKRCDEGSN